MVVFFTEQDLVSFGNFMLSKERIDYYIKEGVKGEDLEGVKNNVVESDLEVWASNNRTGE